MVNDHKPKHYRKIAYTVKSGMCLSSLLLKRRARRRPPAAIKTCQAPSNWGSLALLIHCLYVYAHSSCSPLCARCTYKLHALAHTLS